MNSTASGISGRVLDVATTQPIPFATVTVSVNAVHKGGATTDMNGRFVIKPLDPGYYNLEAASKSFQPAQLKEIDVVSGEVTAVTVPMNAIPV
jgi:hypothetical protein